MRYNHAEPGAFTLLLAAGGVSIPNLAAQLLTAADGGPFVGSGLKPLFSPEMHGVTPLADAARRLDVSCGKRRAALPLAPGASPRLSERAVRRT
jgi:hypothetical protein